jgi:hypothetical protein
MVFLAQRFHKVPHGINIELGRIRHDKREGDKYYKTQIFIIEEYKFYFIFKFLLEFFFLKIILL